MLSLPMEIVPSCIFTLTKPIHGNVCFSNCRVFVANSGFSYKVRENGEAKNRQLSCGLQRAWLKAKIVTKRFNH